MFRIVLPCYIVVTFISLASSYVPVKGGRHSITPKDDSTPIANNDKVILPLLIQDQDNSAISQNGVTSKSVIEDASKNIAEELNHKSNTYSNNREEQVDINQSKRDSSTTHTENHHTDNGHEQKRIFKEVKESSYHDEVTIRNQVIYKHGADLNENTERSNRSENEYQLSISDDGRKVSVSNQEGKNVEANHNEEFLHISNKQDPSKYHIEQHSSFDGIRIDQHQNVAHNHQSKQVNSEVPVDIHEKFVSNSDRNLAAEGHQQNEERVFTQNNKSGFNENNSDNQNHRTILHNDHVGKDSGINTHESNHKNGMREFEYQNKADSGLKNYNTNSNDNEGKSKSGSGYDINEERVSIQQNTNSNDVSNVPKQSNDKTHFHVDSSGNNTEINIQEQSQHSLSEGKHHLATSNKEQNFNTKNIHHKNSQHESSLEHSNEDSIGKRVYDHEHGHGHHHDIIPYYHVRDHPFFEHHDAHLDKYDSEEHQDDRYHHPDSVDHSWEDYDNYHFGSHHDSHHGHGSHGHGHH